MEPKTICNQIFTIKKSQPIIVEPEKKTNTGLYFLSNLDQIFAAIIPTVYMYKPQEGDENISKDAVTVIREALSEVLVHYYPLAGRLIVGDNGKLIVNCTNEGVPFVEAEGDYDIDVLGDITIPDNSMLAKLVKLVHTTLDVEDILQMPLLSVQVTKFRCGSFTLGIALSHLMADGLSAMEFMASWSQTARGLSLKVPPSLDRHALVSRQPPLIQYPHESYTGIEDISDISIKLKEENFTIGTFIFDEEKIAYLKKKAMEDGVIQSCTSFTALISLVWRARCRALKMKPDQKAKLLLVVDGRSKLDPPLPKGYFGNAVVPTTCICLAGELMEKPLSFAVDMVQQSLKLVTSDYIRSAVDYLEVNRGAGANFTTAFIVTSWTRFDFYSANFGWGDPRQFGRTKWAHKEFGLFLPIGKNEKKGVTFLMGLPETYMKCFEEFIEI